MGLGVVTIWLIANLLAARNVRANVQAVFAHFMVGNTASYSVADWQDDMTKAASSHIDGFVLNIARGEATNGPSLANAFTAANNLGSGFKLLFSFDYAGNGLWNKTDVIAMINMYAPNEAYYRRGSQPLVSTFEGAAASADWPNIKQATGCFFMPSWSSLGAGPAWAKGTADGLFSWAAWPEGPNSMSTFTDNSYHDTLGGAPYMMPVSPWFYTNMPGFRKNWLWRGDDLWFDRWVHVMTLQPAYVQIISWNDYGESHHIGPLRDGAYTAFDAAHGRAPFNYALDKPHDGWRTFLPFLIDMAKSNTTSFNQENVVAWYREQPGSACGTGGTTGNTASQLQSVYPPAALSQDRVFYAALLGSAATVSVSIGGQVIAGTWTITPSGGVGLYRGSVATGGRTGTVTVTITRSGMSILSVSGNAITAACAGGITNWNANVIVGTPRSMGSVSPLSLSSSVCTSGFGAPQYLELCSFACRYGYCPPVCTCTSLGAAITRRVALDVNGCPRPGADSTYLGLCSFGCNYGYCPASLCQVYPADHICTAPDPTAPPIPVCVAGMADGAYADLCSFSCRYGFCPPEICICTEASTAGPTAPALTSMVGGPLGNTDYGLCQWTCAHGNCPSNLCTCSGSGCAGGGGLPGGFALSFQDPTNLAMAQVLGLGGGSNLPQGGWSMGNLGGGAHGAQGNVGGSGGAQGGLDGGGGAQGNLGGSSSSQCRLTPRCSNQNDNFDSRCDASEVKLGWDKDGCPGNGQGRSICCAASEAVTTCTWRGGNGIDCNAQCEAGETQLWASRWGDSDFEVGGGLACTTGTKAFCCGAIEYAAATRGCHWAHCGARCSKQEDVMFRRVVDGWCSAGYHSQEYCCPKPAALKECRWTGTWPGCSDAGCDGDEVTVARDGYGDSEYRCWWFRSRTACCKLNLAKPPVLYYCPAEDSYECESYDECPDTWNDGDHDGVGVLSKRRPPRKYDLEDVVDLYTIFARSHPSRGPMAAKMLGMYGTVVWFGASALCDGVEIIRRTTTVLSALPKALDTEHPIDLQIVIAFIGTCITGILPGGRQSFVTTIPVQWFNTVFNAENILAATLPRVSALSPIITNPVQRIFEALGSYTNLGPFLLADARMNQIKGAFAGFKPAMSPSTMRDLYYESIGGVTTAIRDKARAKWMTEIQKSINLFSYLDHPEFRAHLDGVVTNVRTQLLLIEQNTSGGAGLLSHWDEFWHAQKDEMPRYAQQQVREHIQLMSYLVSRTMPADALVMTFTLDTWYAATANMIWP